MKQTFETTPRGQSEMTPRATQVLELARRYADERGDTYVGTEHLLYGLTCLENTLAGRILLKYGVTTNLVRQVVNMQG